MIFLHVLETIFTFFKQICNSFTDIYDIYDKLLGFSRLDD